MRAWLCGRRCRGHVCVGVFGCLCDHCHSRVGVHSRPALPSLNRLALTPPFSHRHLSNLSPDENKVTGNCATFAVAKPSC